MIIGKLGIIGNNRGAAAQGKSWILAWDSPSMALFSTAGTLDPVAGSYTSQYLNLPTKSRITPIQSVSVEQFLRYVYDTVNKSVSIHTSDLFVQTPNRVQYLFISQTEYTQLNYATVPAGYDTTRFYPARRYAAPVQRQIDPAWITHTNAPGGAHSYLYFGLYSGTVTNLTTGQTVSANHLTGVETAIPSGSTPFSVVSLLVAPGDIIEFSANCITTSSISMVGEGASSTYGRFETTYDYSEKAPASQAPALVLGSISQLYDTGPLAMYGMTSATATYADFPAIRFTVDIFIGVYSVTQMILPIIGTVNIISTATYISISITNPVNNVARVPPTQINYTPGTGYITLDIEYFNSNINLSVKETIFPTLPPLATASGPYTPQANSTITTWLFTKSVGGIRCKNLKMYYWG